MSKGESKRIVIEVDTALKRKLYTVLAAENSTLKDWFITAATSYIADREQPSLLHLLSNKRAEEAAS